MSQEAHYVNPPWGLFPPYGFMNKDDMSSVMDKSKPEAWRDSQKSYDDWFNCTLKKIQSLLWPIFDEEKRTWEGDSKSSMFDLTSIDLTLMRELYTGSTEAI